MLVEHVLLGAIQLYRDENQDFSAEEQSLENEIRNFRQPSNQKSVDISEEASEQLRLIWAASDLRDYLLSKNLSASQETAEVNFAKEVSEHEKAPTEQDLISSFEKLEKLVGLNSVKNEVKKLVAVHQANLLRKEEGLPAVNQGLHLIFTGSPGTGKTTVARIMAEIYKSIGLLNSGQLVEVSRQDLVAGYVGQTALKVKDAIERAEGGILFIDEAYSLISDSGAGFGDEAISTLVKEMEDRRSTLAVIAAGYSEEMKQFAQSNPGLKSRFKTVIDFPDYSPYELKEIFQNMLSDHKLRISKDLEENLEELFSNADFSGESGNARFVRNLFEDAFANMATRAAQDGNLDISEIESIDLIDIPEIYSKGKPTFGFS